MFILTFWKVSLNSKAFTFVGVLPMAVAIIVVIVEMAVAVLMAVVMVVVMTAAAVIAPEKGSGKNPEKSSLRKKEIPLGAFNIK